MAKTVYFNTKTCIVICDEGKFVDLTQLDTQNPSCSTSTCVYDAISRNTITKVDRLT